MLGEKLFVIGIENSIACPSGGIQGKLWLILMGFDIESSLIWNLMVYYTYPYPHTYLYPICNFMMPSICECVHKAAMCVNNTSATLYTYTCVCTHTHTRAHTHTHTHTHTPWGSYTWVRRAAAGWSWAWKLRGQPSLVSEMAQWCPLWDNGRWTVSLWPEWGKNDIVVRPLRADET